MLPNAAWDAIKWAAKKALERDAIEKALGDTAEQLRPLGDFRPILIPWVDTAEFAEALAVFDAGGSEQEFVDAALPGFTSPNLFLAGTWNPDLAEEILGAFYTHLQARTLESERGLQLLEARLSAGVEGLAAGIAEVRIVQEEQREEARADRQAAHNATDELLGLTRQLVAQTAPVAPAGAAPAPSAEDARFQGRLDTAAGLIRRWELPLALDLLQELRIEIDAQDTSPEFRYRLAMNLGVCHLHLGEYEAASAEFARARELRPRESAAWTNAAEAALQGDKPGDALTYARRARELAPEDGRAASVYVRALHRTEGVGGVEAFVAENEWITREPISGCALGLVFQEEGRHAEAEGLFRAAVAADADGPNGHALLASALVEQVRGPTRADPPAVWRLPDEPRARLEEAERELTRAAEILDLTGTRRQHLEALLGRANVRLMLGRDRDGLADAEEVLRQDPANAAAQRTRIMLLLGADRRDDAIAAFEDVRDPDARRELAVPIAALLLTRRQATEALALVRPLWEEGNDRRFRLDIGPLLVRTYHLLGDRPAAEAVIVALEEGHPEDPEVLAVRADLLALEGDRDAAITLLERGRQLAAGNTQARLTAQLAELHYERREYARAAELHAAVVVPDGEDILYQHYLLALDQAGRYADILREAERAHEAGESIVLADALAAGVFAEIGDVTAARDLNLALRARVPEPAQAVLNAARLEIRRGDPDAARQLLTDHLAPQEYADRPSLLLELATLKRLLEEPGVVELAYRAWRLDPDAEATQFGYVQAFIEGEGFDPVVAEAPEQVAPETTAILVRPGREEARAYTILSENGARRERLELRPDDEIACALLGRRVGELVSLGGETWEVGGIATKYLHAFQEIIRQYPARFPFSTSLRARDVRHEAGGVGAFLAEIQEQERGRARYWVAYEHGEVALGGLASLVGLQSALGAWLRIVTQPGRRLLADSGAAPVANELAPLRGQRALVLDTPACCTVVLLGLEDVVSRHFAERLVTAQAVLDEVLAEQTILGAAATVPALVRGLTPREFVDKVRGFILSATHVRPARGALALGRERYQLLGRAFGGGPSAAVLVAEELGGVLYSDDLETRNLAVHGWGLNTVWSGGILDALHAAGALDEDAYLEALRVLARHQYFRPQLPSQLFLWVLRQNNGSVTDEVVRLFDRLKDRDVLIDGAVRVIAEVLYRVYLDEPIPFRRAALLDVALAALTDARDSGPIVDSLEGLLVANLGNAPSVQNALVADLAAWRHHRRGGVPAPRSRR